MSTIDPQSTSSPSAAPSCGNCGAAVESSSITCPACGVLLAAYQSATGSSSQSSAYSGGDSSATHHTPGAESGTGFGSSATGPSTVTPGSAYEATPSPPYDPTPPGSPPPYATPPTHQPRSSSPIGDALRSSQVDMTTPIQPDALVESDAPAEELTRMVSSYDGLTGMASGEDELAEMASGEDELARMASGGKSTLAEQVEAELTGAKVVFDGADPVIEAPDVTVSNPGEGEPDVVEHHPPSDSGDPPESGVPTAFSSLFPSDTPAEAPRTAANPAGRGTERPSGNAARPSTPSASPRSKPAAPATDTTRQKYQAPAIDWVDSGHPRTTGPTTASTGAPPAFPDPAEKQVVMTKAALMGCLPFILVLSLSTFVLRGGNAGSTFFGILAIAGLFYLLLKAAGGTSRRTTDMPLDNTFGTKRKR